MGWQDAPVVGGGGSWRDAPLLTEERPKKEELGMDPGMAGMVAAGRYFDRSAAGLRDAVPAPIRRAIDALGSKLGMAQPPSVDPQVIAEDDKAFAGLQEKHPVATFLGDLAPRMLTANPVAAGVMAGVEYGTPAERASRALMAYGGTKAGQWAGGKLAERSASRAVERAPSQFPARDETVRELLDAGLKLPPDQVNPSALNRMLTGLAGKANTQQSMAIANEPKLVDIARRELGIPEGVALDSKTIANVRSEAGKAYETLKGFGAVTADAEHKTALNALTAEYRTVVADFPQMRNKTIESLIKMVDKPQFNSNSAVELVKQLRRDSRANFKAFDDPKRLAVAKVQIGVADAIEDLMERNLAATGQAGFLDIFRAARTRIAKAHTVEDALEESTGKIVASKIKGGHLTGGLATIAKAHEAFPKSVQNINTPMPGLSPLDFFAGLLGGQAGGLGAGLGIPLVRPLTRAGITSDAFQKGLLPKGGDPFKIDKDLAKKLGGLLGLSALEAYQ